MAKKRKSLGKGLEALLGDNFESSIESPTPIYSSNNSTNELTIANISPAPDQPRKLFDESAIEELAASIKQQGVIQPIIVRQADETSESQYIIVVGERRWRAAQKAGLTSIPALIQDYNLKDSHIVALLENIQRQDLNPIEIAQALNKLCSEHQLSHSQIAEALGISRPAVSNLIRLAELPPSIKDMIHQGQLDMGHARAVLSIDQQHRIPLAQHIATKKLTVRQAEALAKQWPLEKKINSKQQSQQDVDIANFIRDCSEILSAKVNIDHKANGKGKLIIHYTSLEQLHHLVEKMAPQLASSINENQTNDLT